MLTPATASLKPIQLQNIILIFNSKLSSAQMKPNPTKEAQISKLAQNQQKSGQHKLSEAPQSKKDPQEGRSMQNQSEFLLNKKEKPSRGRPKLTVTEPKTHRQIAQLRSEDSHPKEPPKPDSLSEKLQSCQRYTGKQQYQNNRPNDKKKNHKQLGTAKTQSEQSIRQLSVRPREQDSEKKSKREANELKKADKAKKEAQEVKEQLSDEALSNKKEAGEQFSEALLTIFRQKYPYYVVGECSIAFPIEDSLLSQYPELTAGEVKSMISDDFVEVLPKTFNKELQIWNILIEHASFFEIKEEIAVSEIKRIFSNSKGQLCKKLWKQLNRFYLNDILYHHYEESSNEEYYSFISLWRYTDENGFLDRLFHTSWNKFIHFYINLSKPHYSNPHILQELNHFDRLFRDQLQQGKFLLPDNYSQLLDYLVLLINMCFETHTFKNLINGKMLFFRDNNKIKNQLLQEKKNLESSLWELKEHEKALIKKDKVAKKAVKKERKNSLGDKIDGLVRQIEEVTEARQTIQAKRDTLHQKITDIDNKIYELCCLPEFSNVWLLGEDRHKNLYWFVREQEEAIYREDVRTGEWAMIRGQNIERLHQSLNVRGIRERKLYEKLLYYKQLGYIKTEINDPNSFIELENIAFQPQTERREAPDEAPVHQFLQNIEMEQEHRVAYDSNEFDRFVYGEYRLATPGIVKLMILKSEWMMTKYLFERNSKWTSQELRQDYINKIIGCNLEDASIYNQLTSDLRSFNEKICVVQINIRTNNQADQVEVKTRKIQTKIWGINQKYKHFWYDYSRKCRTLSDLHFLISVLYLTIERYVTKTRKPNNTKYFFKTVEFGETHELCELCQSGLAERGEFQSCPECLVLYHGECLARHAEECPRNARPPMEFGPNSDLNE